jgi:hypothetical protein
LAFCLWTNRGKGDSSDSPFTRWVEWQARFKEASKEASPTHADSGGSSAVNNGESDATRVSAVAEYDAIYLGQGQSRSPAFVPHVVSRSLSVAEKSPTSKVVASRANFSSSQQRRASRYSSDLNNNL